MRFSKIVGKTIRTVSFSGICGLLFLTALNVSSAQCDSTKQYMVNVADQAGPIGGAPNSFIPIEKISPDYTFFTVCDSAVVKLWVSNFTHNGNRLFLNDWCADKNTDIADEQIPRSRTQSLTLQPGDRVGVFREFWWYEPHTNDLNPQKYLGTADVGYSIDIVDAASGERITQIDSIFLGAHSPISPLPYFVSMYPAVALIEYHYPANAPERKVFIGIRAKQQGKTNFPLYRIDGFAVRHTDDLSVDSWKNYAQELEQSSTSSSVGLGNQSTALTSTNTGNVLRVIGLSMTLSITLQGRLPLLDGIIRVADINGVQYLQSQLSAIQQQETVVVPNQGIYIVTLTNSVGATVEVHKVLVTTY